MNYTLEKANTYIQDNRNKVIPIHRHKYHLMPPVGWMNDPNGVTFYRGQYHVFYQFYPYDSQWGPMHWGHAVSRDLLNWQHLPVALAPDLVHEDGCFSGGSIVLDDKIYLLYTSHFNQKYQKQEQSLAISEDGINFKKYKEKPVITVEQLPENASKSDFRDPNPITIDGHHFLLIGSTDLNQNGQILVYKTDDFINYEYLNAIGSNPLFGEITECPDLFELDGKHVLIFSATNLAKQGNRFKNVNSSLYAVGHFDVNTGHFEIENIDEIDLGHHFYAPQTLLNDQGQRIMIAWMEMWQKPYITHLINHQWVGAMSLPRVLSLVDNKLIQKPIDTNKIKNKEISIESLLEGHAIPLNKTFHLSAKISNTSNTIFKITGAPDNYFTLSCSKDAITLDTSTTHLLPLESRYIEHGSKKEVSIDIFMDVSSVEVFVKNNDKTITTRVYFDEEQIQLVIEQGNKNINDLKLVTF